MNECTHLCIKATSTYNLCGVDQTIIDEYVYDMSLQYIYVVDTNCKCSFRLCIGTV